MTGIPGAPAALELQEVCVDFPGHRALDRLTLTLRPGEQVGLIGPSGAGKTTLLRLVNGMQSPTTGQVRTLGCDPSALSPASLRDLRRRIALLPQDLALVPNLRAVQNILCGRLGQWRTATALRQMLWPGRAELLEAHALLERTGIGSRLFERTDRLSGGEQQRVAIARALFQRPSLLLADEPVSSVDPARAADTVALLCRLSSESGLTLVVSLHNFDLARDSLPRLIGLRDGRILHDGPASSWTDNRIRDLYALAPGNGQPSSAP